MQTPRGWRAIVVDGVAYLWCTKLGRDVFHDPVRLFVRHAESIGDTRLRARGSTLIIETAFGGTQRCSGGQCDVPLAPQPIGPAQIADFVRTGSARGWRQMGPSLRLPANR